MKKLLSLLFNRWTLAIVGLIALALAVWIIGPLVAIGNTRILESETSRIVLIVGVVALWCLIQLWSAWRARRRNANVVAELMRSAKQANADAPPGPAQAELEKIRQTFDSALETLQKARFEKSPGLRASLNARLGKRYLYELPWYVIIGAPGSGKTTALMNAGLRFPLEERGGDALVEGVGGTRNCKWWFTSEAVLIDTAGRYTTQDSVPEQDRAAWLGFLDLLKGSRPRQPVNGILVTVSVDDLLVRDAAARAAQAAALRARIQELHGRLGIRFPIYLLVTKCDLLSGFVERFGDLDAGGRAEPWGYSFELDGNARADASTLQAEFDALVKRLDDGLVERLEAEPDTGRRTRIYGFTQQFAALGPLVKRFTDAVFAGSQFEEHPLLRGVYFISGTQLGTPIDRVMGRIGRSLGLERRLVPANTPSGRSYFLNRLLREVVFAEAGLAGTNLKWERRRNVVVAAASAAVIALAVGLLAAWGVSTIRNSTYIESVEARTEALAKTIQSTPERGTTDLMRLLPALREMRTVAGTGESSTLLMRFGLFQGEKLETAADQAYRRMLVEGLQPRLSMRIEAQLRSMSDNRELLYEALKAYLMMQDAKRFDAVSLRSYLLADLDNNLPRETPPEDRAELERQVDALLSMGAVVSPVPEDKALIAQARARLAQMPLAERVYSRMKRDRIGADQPEFTIAKAAGPSASLVFTRISGQPLTRGVPGLYTYDGYYKAFQREVEKATRQLAAEEGWVLGLSESTALTEPLALDRATDAVRRLYLLDYVRIWEQFIGDIKLVPTGNLSQSVQLARVMSAPDGPFVPLIKGLVRETTLVSAPDKDAIERAENKARSVIDESRRRMGNLFGSNAAPGPVAVGQRIESIVDERFAALRRLVAAQDGQPAPIDATVGLMNEIYNALVAADTAVKSGAVAPVSDVPTKVAGQAARQPEPVRSLLTALSASGTGAALSGSSRNLDIALRASVGDFCRQAITGRYPFTRSSNRDVTQDDFARLFAPGGLFDDFFQKNLANFVDTSTKPWSARQLGDGRLPITTATLRQFQRAAAIRDTFFRGGGKVASLRLEIKPVQMDASVTQFLLDVDGQVIRYAHGPQIPTQVQWPGPANTGQVRVQLSPQGNGQSGLLTEGPWALFRLFEQVQIEPTQVPERFQATFNLDGRKTAFEVTTNSVLNPFRLRDLQEFACPGGS